MKTSIVIPNYNGMDFLPDCLNALYEQTEKDFEIIVVDNGSRDGSLQYLKELPSVRMISFPRNEGFCKAVNAGIKAALGEYVVLLNNDTRVFPDYLEKLVGAISSSEKIFSVSPKMIMMKNPDLIDDAGDLYCALGWAFSRGKGKPLSSYDTAENIFASCGGAAIYRKSVFDEIGYFDEKHFAYLEDIDMGYRARIFGYINRYEPAARVYHFGSGFSGSRYNEFKVSLSSKNSIYLIVKNMPVLQQIINLPFLCVGFGIKIIFFMKKGMGRTYFSGLIKGLSFSYSKEGRKQKIPFKMENITNYFRIQLELWYNVFARFMG